MNSSHVGLRMRSHWWTSACLTTSSSATESACHSQNVDLSNMWSADGGAAASRHYLALLLHISFPVRRSFLPSYHSCGGHHEHRFTSQYTPDDRAVLGGGRRLEVPRVA